MNHTVTDLAIDIHLVLEAWGAIKAGRGALQVGVAISDGRLPPRCGRAAACRRGVVAAGVGLAPAVGISPVAGGVFGAAAVRVGLARRHVGGSTTSSAFQTIERGC
jgi:hypothetical protein